VTVPITASNSTTGAGVFDSWKQVGDSIGKVQTEHGGDLAAVSVELGINVISAALDTVAFVMDPLAKLIAAGLGWLIEHVSFLKWPLDQVAGNPAEVTKVANELHKIGESLRNTGTSLDDTLKSTITQWQGKGYDSFLKSINERKGWIDANAKAADVAGYMVETTGALIGAVRSLLRDIITTILGDIISTMLIALALAIPTFGASIAVGVGKVVVQVSVQVAAMMAKLAKVVAYAGRTLARLTGLSKLVKGKPGSSSSAGHEMTPMPPPGTAITHDGPGGGATPSTRPPGDGTTPNFSRPLPPPGTAVTHHAQLLAAAAEARGPATRAQAAVPAVAPERPRLPDDQEARGLAEDQVRRQLPEDEVRRRLAEGQSPGLLPDAEGALRRQELEELRRLGRQGHRPGRPWSHRHPDAGGSRLGRGRQEAAGTAAALESQSREGLLTGRESR
jgi:hypothetical protein